MSNSFHLKIGNALIWQIQSWLFLKGNKRYRRDKIFIDPSIFFQSQYISITVTVESVRSDLKFQSFKS